VAKKETTKKLLVLIFFTILLPTIVSARMSSGNFLIDSDSLNMGGGQSTSTNFVLNDSLGEIAAQNSTSTNFQELLIVSSYLFRTFTITAPTTTSLTSKTISTTSQTTSGTISNIEIINDGTVSWSVTLNTTHFTSTSTVKLLSGLNSTVDFTGTYDGLDGVLDPNGTFIVEIVETGGAVGTAVYQFTDPAGNVSATTTTSSTEVLTNGISATFASATYVVGDKWSVGVDVFPYTGLQVTPGTITVVSGETGVSAGSVETLSGTGVTSDSKTLMTGQSNDSAGTYRQNQDLELTIHPNSLDGSFTADATLTLI